MEKKAFFEEVAEQLIEQLKQGTSPLQRVWEPGMGAMPFNPTTGKRYRGGNALWLSMQGRGDPRWLTYKQAQAEGAQVRKGEKSTTIEYWKFREEQVKRGEDGKPILDASGNKVMVSVELERPKVFYAKVFNAEQIDGLPPLQRKEQTWDAVDRAERIVAASGARIIHEPGDRAFYRPSTDSITLPEKGQFPSAANYHAVQMHELGHWTGHPSRLDRDLSHPFGSEGYAREELRAEIASMMLGMELGLGRDPGQHAAYVGSWIQVLEEDPRELFRAAADAEKIQQFILAFEQVQDLGQEQQVKGAQSSDVQQGAKPMESHHQEEIQSEQIDYNAERWILGRIDSQLLKDLDRMDSRQLATVDQVLGSMLPLNNSNPFWQRHEHAAEAMFGDIDRFEAKLEDLHEVVLDKIYERDHGILPSTPTERLIHVLKVQRNYLLEGEYDAAAVHRAEAVQPAFFEALDADSPMPTNWTGNVRIHAAEGGGHVVECELAEGVHVPIATRSSAEAAQSLADTLREIDARAQLDPNEAAVRLAALHEDQVRRNPNSSAEEVSAAREAKKGAEITAALNSLGLAETESSEAVDLRNVASQNTWLAVPFEEREAAKRAAGKLPSGKPAIDFDSSTKCWYARPGADLDKLREWLPQNRPVQQRAESPEDELAAAMREMGLVVEGEHPIIDGEWHRVPVQGASKGNTSGAYKAYPVKEGEKGVPAGTIQNHRTGAKTNWKAKGYVLSDSDRAQMHADSALQRSARDAERAAAQARAEKAIGELLAVAAPAPADATYLANKNARADGLKAVPADSKALPADTIILIGKTAQESKALRKDHPDKLVFTAGDLLLTAQDMTGAVKSVQSIRPNGTKMFAKGTEKHGHFHVTGNGGVQSLEAAPVIVISEGYATADTVSQILGYPTVASFDSGNLPGIGRQLRERFPDKPILFAGDNDQHLVLIDGKNPGREKAELAAAETGGVAIFPIFAPGEQEYPADVEPIDREKAKANELTEKQSEALNAMKKFTDFNDLALKSKLGKEGVERQLRGGVALAIKAQQERSQRLGQEQVLQQAREEIQGVEAPTKRRTMKM